MRIVDKPGARTRSSVVPKRLAVPAALALAGATTAGMMVIGPEAANAAGSALTLASSASPASFTGPGQSLSLSYVITNNSPETLYNVGVQDSQSGLSPISCPNPTLAAGASETCSATYVTTQADFDRGYVTDVATASGALPSEAGSIVSEPASLTIPDDKAAAPLAATDVAAPDVAAPDVAAPDAAAPDAAAPDDLAATDLAATDLAATDPAATDPAATDSGVVDSGIVDSGIVDSGIVDASPLAVTDPAESCDTSAPFSMTSLLGIPMASFGNCLTPYPPKPGGVTFVAVPFPLPIGDLDDRDKDRRDDGIGAGGVGVGVVGVGVGGGGVGPAGTSPVAGGPVSVTG